MMSTHEIHPLAACLPSLPEAEFAALKEHIRLNGQQNAIDLFEGKIIDGVHRNRACHELGIEPRYKTPEITDPLTYVIGQNVIRRHLTIGQRTDAAEKMASWVNGSNQFKRQGPHKGEPSVKQPNAAALWNVSPSSIGYLRQATKRGIPEIRQAVRDGKLAVRAAARVADLPKEAQPKALTAELAGGSRKRKVPAKTESTEAKSPQPVKAQPAEEAFLRAPSIYPLDAKIPQGGGEDERRLREAIEHLRNNEPEIPTYGRRKLDQNIYPFTQYIQAYVINRFQNPRPEPLDPRIREWARNVAERMLARRNYLLSVPEPKTESQHYIGGFEGFWRSYWREESALLRRFPVKMFEQIKERWLERATEIFRQKQLNAERLKLDRKKPAPAPGA